MPLGFGNLTTIEWVVVIVVVIVVGLVILAVPVIGLLAVRVFNEFETQRRSEVVDQALTRDEEITPLPAADEPAGTDRRA